MKIIESWEDHTQGVYAVVRYSKKEHRKSGDKKYEAMWLVDETRKSLQLFSFGGSVGYTTAHFATVEEAQDFLLKGIGLKDKNSEIFLKMVDGHNL